MMLHRWAVLGTHIVLGQRLFIRHRIEWMAWILWTYCKEIIQDFYASYMASLIGSLKSWARPIKQDPFTTLVVRGCLLDIAPITIRISCMEPPLTYSGTFESKV